MESPGRRLRTPEAARYLGLSWRTLQNFRISGVGPRFSKLGRSVVYSIPDLDKWVEERVRFSTAEYRDNALDSSQGTAI